MKQLALALATGALVLTSPVLASESDENTVERSAFSVDASSLKRTYFYDGFEYSYSRSDVTLLGDITGGANTL